jgi:hypothetical protein
MYLYIGQIKRIAAGMLHSACIDEKGTLFIFGQKTEKVVQRMALIFIALVEIYFFEFPSFLCI